jgi:hypothetical protein
MDTVPRIKNQQERYVVKAKLLPPFLGLNHFTELVFGKIKPFPENYFFVLFFVLFVLAFSKSIAYVSYIFWQELIAINFPVNTGFTAPTGFGVLC